MSLSIYIPRILGSVKKQVIYDAFDRMMIGNVTELDMVYKINENRNAYYFAFIKINPYNTPQYAALQYKLNNTKQTHLMYDEKAGQYWEIKKYIPREQRNKENIEQTLIPMNTIYDWNMPSNWQFDSSLFTQTHTIWTPFAPTHGMSSVYDETHPTVFSEKDKYDLVEEYEELEKQIRIEVSHI